MRPAIERALSKVEVRGFGCWEFAGARSEGYGVIGRGGRGAGNVYVHRLTYEHFVGPIPDGLHIDHLCRNRACCNPRHLEPVTQAENNRRAALATPLSAHCIHGHEYTPENTNVIRKPDGSFKQRQCLTCRRAQSRKRTLEPTNV